MSKTSIGWLELDALSAEPTGDASRYGFCIISGTPYYWDGSSWNEFATSGGSAVGTMEDTYENGRTIGIDTGAIVLNDATTAALNTLELNKTGAGTGNMIDIDMDAGIAAGGIFIDCGGGARTGTDILVTDDSTGNHTVIDINSSGAGVTTGLAWTDSYNGNGGNTGVLLTLDANDGLTSTALSIVRGAGIRTTGAINIDDGSTGSGALIDIDLTGAYTGNIIDFATSGIATGNVLNINLDTAVAMTAIHLEGSGVRTEPFIEMASDATGSSNIATFTPSGATWSGHVLQFLMTAATTGDVINIDMNAAVGGRAIYIDSGAVARTAVLIDILADGTGDVDVFNIDESNDGSGNVFDINVSGVGSGNVIDITYSAADTGDALHIDMGTNLAGNAIQIDAAGARTAPLIYIANTGTDGGTDDHVAFIYQTGVLDSNLLQLTYATGASTGNAIAIAMGTNVAGMAVDINSSGTGVSGEGSALDITHDGVLVAGADIVSIKASGAISSTSNALSIATIGDAGSYALYINATGSAEAIHVDAGTVTFDETLTVTGTTALVGAVTLTAGITVGGTLAVTGAATLSSTLSYRHLTEAVTATNTITAAESGTVFFLNSATEFVSTLPAPAAGLHFTFIVKAAPSGASYTVVTNSSNNIIIGLQNSVAGDAGDSGTTDDTITFVNGQSVVGDKVEIHCDGTYWYAHAISKVAAGITFTTAS